MVCVWSAVLKWVGNDDLKGRTALLHMSANVCKKPSRNFQQLLPWQSWTGAAERDRQARETSAFICSLPTLFG